MDQGKTIYFKSLIMERNINYLLFLFILKEGDKYKIIIL